jgi:hypothetical protein
MVQIVREMTRVGAALLIAGVTGCASTRGTEPVGPMTQVDFARQGMDLADARHRWETSGLGSYRFTLARTTCECLPEWTRPMRLIVRQGSSPRVEIIESLTDAVTGAPVSEARERYALGVEALFDLIERAINGGAAEVRARYDANLGFPTRILIDPSAQTVDDQIVLVASGVAPD